MPHDRFIAIRKPKGPTSHDIVDAVRRITGERRVGHAGTLDPMASGVLVIGIGREATKHLATIVGHEKEYVARVRLGATSTTDDAEGLVSESVNQGSVNQASIERVLPKFIGRITQTPPVYSAVKVRGKPAHRRVRGGEMVELQPRTVDIRAIDIIAYSWPSLEIRVTCGPGVYIRALARDIGQALGVGGYLTALERTRVGTYTLADALTLTAFAESWNHTHET
ncbi:tRNA pseudouridine(55) synthase TruB [Candidatus Uhrbacteria bacterium]|nr:tRNA pseudouridine(55) synthase TruB [Candidatus Uhrbacteria bacterium]